MGGKLEGKLRLEVDWLVLVFGPCLMLLTVLLTRLDVLWLRVLWGWCSLTAKLLLRLVGLGGGSGCGNFDDNVRWLTNYFSFEAFLWVGSVANGAAEIININVNYWLERK